MTTINALSQSCECNGEPHAAGCPLSITVTPAQQDAMLCGACGNWFRIGNRTERGICLEVKSRRDETDAGETCGYWTAV